RAVRRLMLMRIAGRRSSAACLCLSVVCAALIGVGIGNLASASASASASTPVTCTNLDDPRCVIHVSDPGGGTGPTAPVSTGAGGCRPPGGPGIPAGVDCNGCIWSAYSPAPGQVDDDPAYEEWLAAGGKGSVQQQDCYPGPTTSVQYFPPGAAPPPPGVPAAQLGVDAASLLPFPTVTMGSAPGAEGRAFAMTFVNLPTFLWVDNAQWIPLAATANDGVKAVTATAVPSYVTWVMGDGRSTICSGPGVAWQPGIEASGCSHTYTTSSVHEPQVGSDVNDRPYTVTATVTYQVTWTCAGQCGGVASGTVGAVVGPTSRSSLVVGEIQTVVSG
ncbi:MAG TPA: hypothetical protein VGD55_05015, partial [Acidothermaceae bacterium]